MTLRIKNSNNSNIQKFTSRENKNRTMRKRSRANSHSIFLELITICSEVWQKTHKYREHTDGCQREVGGGRGKMGEADWEEQASSYGAIKSQIKGIAQRVQSMILYQCCVVTEGSYTYVCSIRYGLVQSLDCTPETNVTLCTSCTSIKTNNSSWRVVREISKHYLMNIYLIIVATEYLLPKEPPQSLRSWAVPHPCSFCCNKGMRQKGHSDQVKGYKIKNWSKYLHICCLLSTSIISYYEKLHWFTY